MITQFYVPAEASAIPQLVPEKRLITANSMFSFTYYTSLAFGSILSGPVLRLLSARGVFLAIVFLFIGAAGSVSALPITSRLRHELGRIARFPLEGIIVRIVESVIQGIGYVRRSPILADALLLLAGTQILLSLLGTLGPGFADQVLKIDIHDASLVLVVPAIVGIIAGALWVGQVGNTIPPNRLIKRGIIAAGLILVTIALLVNIGAIAPNVAAIVQPVIIPVTLILFFLLGVANSMLDVPANSILQKEAEGALRGRVYGMLTAAVGGIGILPVFVGGVLADTLGIGTVVLLLGVAVLSYGIVRVRYNTA
jgi:MFS family permease